ncbi:hypothetical protein [Aquabacterium sp.]|uniref:hypothetical protein n=1 Tax=Aquabacterium sp. TaxID=1872578 RepID=UPI0037850AD8
MHPRRWSDESFPEMSWHDCHVHSLRIQEGDHGAGELELDLDYILEWRNDRENCQFLIVPARLCFHRVFAAKITLDWAGPTAGFGPFSISGVERRMEDRANYIATLWRLPVNWPAGSIEFEAEGFTQEAWGREVVSSQQSLRLSERVDA